MQILLTRLAYGESCADLTHKLLKKQLRTIVEVVMTLESFGGVDAGGVRPPFVLLSGWRKHVQSLAFLGMQTATHLVVNYKDPQPVITKRLTETYKELRDLSGEVNPAPPWIGDLDVHRSHRSNLIRRYPGIYRERFPNTPENMPILYPQVIREEALTAEERASGKSYRLRVTDEDFFRIQTGERRLPGHLYLDTNKREVLRTDG